MNIRLHRPALDGRGRQCQHSQRRSIGRCKRLRTTRFIRQRHRASSMDSGRRTNRRQPSRSALTARDRRYQSLIATSRRPYRMRITPVTHQYRPSRYRLSAPCKCLQYRLNTRQHHLALDGLAHRCPHSGCRLSARFRRLSWMSDHRRHRAAGHGHTALGVVDSLCCSRQRDVVRVVFGPGFQGEQPAEVFG